MSSIVIDVSATFVEITTWREAASDDEPMMMAWHCAIAKGIASR